ncbi:4258_t:CDS:2 [Rhizophagus irregularis]|nr:4258_t:CDS:2 [Rhizophagus irregularis]
MSVEQAVHHWPLTVPACAQKVRVFGILTEFGFGTLIVDDTSKSKDQITMLTLLSGIHLLSIASWRIIVELLDYTIRILILDDASYSSLVVIRDMRFHSRIRNRVAL